MTYIDNKYKELCGIRSDINEHLPTLYRYAQQCESIIETGVRGVVSSWALVCGLLHNEKPKKNILLNDIVACDINEILCHSKEFVNISHEWKNNLHLDITENVDMVFIDTWHVYGQLIRELNKFSKITNKYIVMHDTTVDATTGETIRNSWNAHAQSLESGIPVEEINKGIWYAVEDFLRENKNWVLKERYHNNNGLTVLERVL